MQWLILLGAGVSYLTFLILLDHSGQGRETTRKASPKERRTFSARLRSLGFILRSTGKVKEPVKEFKQQVT